MAEEEGEGLKMLSVIAIALLGIGSVGTISASICEWKKKEPIYGIMMKVFPWFFGVGAVLLALTI
jgi:hypothetical protein